MTKLLSICCGYADNEGQHPCPNAEVLNDGGYEVKDAYEVEALIHAGIINALEISHGLCFLCEKLQDEYNEKVFYQLSKMNIK